VTEDMDFEVAADYAPLMAIMPGAMSMAPAEDWNYDEFAPLSTSGYSRTALTPLSTFAADVDTAAYATIRRMINDQRQIPKDAVRIEELVNAFSYNDPGPAGDHPIATNTVVAACPWNSEHLLMRVGLKAIDIDADDLPPSNLVFLIDSSGSMDMPDRLPLVQRSFALLTEQLRPQDRVSVVTYAGHAAVMLEGVPGDQKSTIINAIYDISAGGGTAGAAGIETAYEMAKRYAAPGMNSRVIHATDGDFNIGINSEADLIRLIEDKKNDGIFLTVLGYGMGNYKDNKMQALAEHGNGNATYIDTIHQARQALVTEFGATMVTVAKDVKIQVEFNPEIVAEYRLLGYESRRMASEDFRDDTKDGGELGAGHSMVALYEIIPANTGETGDTGLLYQQIATTGSTDFATVYLRYKEPTGDTAVEIHETVGQDAFTETPNDDFTLSAAVAAFAQMLSGSEFVPFVTAYQSWLPPETETVCVVPE